MKVGLFALVAILLIFPQHVTALTDIHNTLISADSLIGRARSLKLAQDQNWLKLGHYNTVTLSAESRFESAINSPRYFLSKEGRYSPEKELEATLLAIMSHEKINSDEHAQCRFPARYIWLSSILKIDNLAPKAKCTQFRKWASENKIASISVVFATGYLDNPASFFGHILLKLNADRNASPSALLDTSINYGAITNEDDNAVVYIFKGLFGGYQATFSDSHFYLHNHNYGEQELRDLWEYELALPPEQTRYIVSHAWELIGNTQTYYFANHNCAQKMGELLGITVGDLMPNYSWWALPHTLFEKIATRNHQGQPLVKKIKFHPSRQRRFYDQYFQLDRDSKNVLQELITALDFNKVSYKSLPEKNKIALNDTLLDYFEYQRSAQKLDIAEVESAKNRVLLERLRLPPHSPNKPEIQQPAPPHEGQLPSMLRFSTIKTTNHTQLEIRLRPAYYDPLSLDAGRIPNSKVTMLDGRIRFSPENHKIRLHHLDLLDIETINASTTGLPGDGGNAWKINAAYSPQKLSCNKNCNAFNINGGVGRGYVKSTISTHALIGARVESRATDNSFIAIEPQLGTLLSLSHYSKISMNWSYRQYIGENATQFPTVKIEQRIGNSKRWDIRWSYEKIVAEEWSLSTAWYW